VWDEQQEDADMNIRIALLCALGLALTSSEAGAQSAPFTDEFPIEDCTFQSTGSNPFFALKPGRQLHVSNEACFESGDCDEFEEAVITVLSQTRVVTLKDDGKTRNITTRVVKEVARIDGELAEISLNFFAECKDTQDVYYFGEEVDIYENGKVVSHEGAWLAGKKGAEPGIIMPGGAFLLGARYFQEIAPNVALDRAEHVGVDLDIRVPAGRFDDCVKVKETTPLEPGAVSFKVYCPGPGLVIDDELKLEGFFGS
jgi:hypothetical protein